MKLLMYLAVLGVALFNVNAKLSPPKVQVYSRTPGLFGIPNTLICHVKDFHPPDISMLLLEDGKEIPDAFQTDLAFEQTWQFHLTKSVKFTPVKDRQYTCMVQHMNELPKSYNWEADM